MAKREVSVEIVLDWPEGQALALKALGQAYREAKEENEYLRKELDRVLAINEANLDTLEDLQERSENYQQAADFLADALYDEQKANQELLDREEELENRLMALEGEIRQILKYPEVRGELKSNKLSSHSWSAVRMFLRRVGFGRGYYPIELKGYDY